MSFTELLSKTSLSLLVVMVAAFIFPPTVFCQTEKLGTVQYTPPKGWNKTPKENVVAFSNHNQTTGAFCIITYQTYVGKRVRIHGTVNSIEIAKDGRIRLTFKSSISTYNNARCYFSKSEGSRIAALSAHEEATVEGTVRGWEHGFGGAKVFVLMEDCTVP